MALGFPEWAAAMIARADVDTDNAKLYGDLYAAYHQVSWLGRLLGRDPRPRLAENELSAAIAVARTARMAHPDCPSSARQLVLAHLGHGLHALQDMVAHGDYVIHRNHLDDPTKLLSGDPDPGQTRLHAAQAKTEEYLRRALADPDIQWLLSQ